VTAAPQPAQDHTLLARLQRDTVIVGAIATVITLALWPGQPQRAAGVIAGVLLAAISYAGIRAGVDALFTSGGGLRMSGKQPAGDGAVLADDHGGKTRRGRASRGFVKFFTRHAILAASAYVMIARFELHPVAMLAGVTAPAVAAGIEFVRIVRARGTGSHSRSS
jgi:heme A synthase